MESTPKNAPDRIEALAFELIHLAKHYGGHVEDTLRAAATALRTSEAQVRQMREKVSAGFELTAKLCSLPEDDNGMISRKRAMDLVYKWRLAIDASPSLRELLERCAVALPVLISMLKKIECGDAARIGEFLLRDVKDALSSPAVTHPDELGAGGSIQ